MTAHPQDAGSRVNGDSRVAYNVFWRAAVLRPILPSYLAFSARSNCSALALSGALLRHVDVLPGNLANAGNGISERVIPYKFSYLRLSICSTSETVACICASCAQMCDTRCVPDTRRRNRTNFLLRQAISALCQARVQKDRLHPRASLHYFRDLRPQSSKIFIRLRSWVSRRKATLLLGPQ